MEMVSEEINDPAVEINDPALEINDPTVDINDPTVEISDPTVEISCPAVEINGPAVEIGPQRRNRIQVSTNKRPLYFYVNLAKRFMQTHNEIELSALGMAIGTVVTVSEILKNNGLATEKQILTSTVGTKDESKGRLVRKAKIEILLTKTENFHDLMAAAKAERIANSNAAKIKSSLEEVRAEKEKETEEVNG